VYDAVQLFAKALDALPLLSDVRMMSLSCSQDRTWKHGASIINSVKKVILHLVHILRQCL